MLGRRRLRIAGQRLRSLFHGRARDAELDDELRFHLEQLVREKVADGLPIDEARRQARREFGNVTLLREQSREQRRLGWLHDLQQDVVYGWRMLRRHSGFTLVASASLALGIGGSTAVWGAMKSVLLAPLPFASADRLVVIRTSPSDGSAQNQGATLTEYFAWQERGRTLEGFGASLSSPRELGPEPNGPAGERLASQAFTPGLFALLGVPPARGRLFEDTSNPFSPAARVMVISHRLWHRRYGAAPDIIGRVVPTDGSVRTIVGVMPPDFRYQADDVEFWIPLIFGANARQDPGAGRILMVTARLRPGVTLDDAQADLDRVALELASQFPDRFRGRRVSVIPLREAMYGWTEPLLLTLMAAVGLMLVIACVNVAGLLLARGTTRQRELWVRLSLGASRGRIVRQLMTESLLIAIAGGVMGLGIAALGLRVLATAMGPPPGAPRVGALPLDLNLAAVTMGIALLTALAFGILPALVAARRGSPHPAPEFAPAADRPRGSRLRGVLVSGQLALATVLLIGTGLLLNTFLRLDRRELNFDPNGLASFQYVIELRDYAKQIGDDRGLPVFEISPMVSETIARVYERLRLLPGVESVAGASYPPVNSLIVPRYPVIPIDPVAAAREWPSDSTMACFLVTPQFFTTLRTPVVRGRDIQTSDGPSSPGVAIVNEAAARMLWPGREPLGQRLVVDMAAGLPPREVVGVVRDIPLARRAPVAEPIVYIPSRQAPATFRGRAVNVFGHMTFVLRHSIDEAELIAAARQAMADADPSRPMVNPGVVERSLTARLPELRNYVGAVGAFGIAALLLAAMGVYGVTAFAVAARMREMGIRRALGAGSLEVISTIGRRAAVLIVVGVIAGVSGAAGLTRFIASQLWGVAPTDPMTFATAAATLALVAAAACIGPTRRALAVDPASVLRSE